VLHGQDLGALWEHIRSSNFPLLALAAVVATMIFPLRALRWKVILRGVDPDLSLNLLWRSTAVGFGLNNVLPLRIGELARVYALTREAPKVSFTASIASLAVDRVFDAIVIVMLLLIGLLGVPAVRDSGASGDVVLKALAVAALAGCLFLALFALAFFPHRVVWLFQAVIRRLIPALETRGTALIHAFADGLSALKSPRQFAEVFAWTVLHWLVNALAFWIGFAALGLSLESSYLAALATQGIIAVGVAVPQGPAFIGGFQFAAQLALELYGASVDRATAWAFAYWAFSFVPITVIGITYFVRMKLSLREIRERVRSMTGRAQHEAAAPAGD
jgi:hypothetical protein